MSSAPARRPLLASFVFLARFLPMTLTLGLVAAVGRILQEGAAGPISREMFVALEILVEGARVLLVLHVLGLGSIFAGWAVLKGAFRTLRAGQSAWRAALRTRWRSLSLNLVGFLVIAAVANIAIFTLARQNSVLPMLQHCGWIAEQAGPWITVLFIKNLTIIPWTLIFLVTFNSWFTAQPRVARFR